MTHGGGGGGGGGGGSGGGGDGGDDKSKKINQPNMTSTIKVAAKVTEELNQSNENSDTKKGKYSTHKNKISTVLKEETGKQSNA
jgi:hypothetical protein